MFNAEIAFVADRVRPLDLVLNLLGWSMGAADVAASARRWCNWRPSPARTGERRELIHRHLEPETSSSDPA